MTHPLEIRAKAASATFEKFNGKAFQLGKFDCARMTHFHLKQLGRKFSLLKGGEYSTEVGARLALKRLGVESLNDIMDQNFPRIEDENGNVSAAHALVGDVVALRSDTEVGDALGIVLHRGNVLGFLGGVCAELKVSEYSAAWRVV